MKRTLLGLGMMCVFGTVFLSGCGDDNSPTYIVTYEANEADGGAVPVDTVHYEQGQIVTVPGNDGELDRADFTFSGWCVNADGTGDSYAQGQTLVMGSGDLTLYAKWTANPTYTVIYEANGADGGAVPVDTVHYEQGQAVTVPGNTGALERAGFTFSGWCVNAEGTGDSYVQGQTLVMENQDITLYANWTANPTFTVTYEANGADTGAVPVDTVHYEQGETVTVFGNSGNLERDGYTFAGWSVNVDGTGDSYSQGQTFIIADGGVALYARWSLNPTYVVSYDGNGNTGGSVPTDSTHYEENDTVTVLGNTGALVKSQDGKFLVFTGWNTRSDGAGTTYEPGQTFTMGGEDTVLYAKWLPPYILPTTAADVAPSVQSVLVDGNHAYTTDRTELKVFDVSDPVNSLPIGTVVHGYSDLRVEAQVIHNGIVWCVRSSSGGYGEGTHIFGVDTSDPANPVLRGSLTTQASSSLLSPASLIHEGYWLVHDYSRNLIYVIDISDPDAPTIYSSWSVPNMVNGGPGYMTVDGNILYLPSGENRTLRIYDLSDLAAVTEIGVIPTTSECQSTAVKIGSYVYTTASRPVYAGGRWISVSDIQVIDVSDPGNPVLAGNVTEQVGGRLLAKKDRLFLVAYDSPTIQAYSLVDPAAPVLEDSTTLPAGLTIYPMAFSSANWVGDYLIGMTYGSPSGARALDFTVN